VLRRAGEALRRHTDELRDWPVRETGGIPGKAYFELNMTAQVCFDAAALPSRSQGELLPSEASRLSMVRRVPVGVVGVIAPFNGPLVVASRSVAPALALGTRCCSSRTRAPRSAAGSH
jgi:benzaldehyde dehydrogenase (NAD)